MPQRFNNTSDLKPNLDPTLRPIVENPTGQPDNVALINGQVVGSVIDQLADNSGKGPAAAEKALGAYTVEAMNIVDESAKYRTEKDRILASIATADPNDKEAVLKYNDELRRLRAGQLQGMTPAAANLRINDLTKQAINAYPAMTLKFRQLRAGIIEDVSKVTGDAESNPDTEATNQLAKDARLNGWDVQSQIAYNHAQAAAKTSQLTLQAKLDAGSANENDVSAMVYAQANAVTSKIMGDMGNAVRRPDFQGVKFLPELHTARATLESTIRQNLIQTQIEKNFKFTPDYMDKTVAVALAPIDELIKIADKVDNPKTRAETATQLAAAQKQTDYMALRRLIGPMAVLATSTQDIMGYLGEISRYREQIFAGQRATLDSLASSGDVKAQLLLGVIDGKDFDSNLASAVKATAEGNHIAPASTPEEGKMRVQVSINAALSPKTEKAQSENMLATLAGQPDAFEAWDARSDVKERTKLFPKVQAALRENATKQQLSAISKMNRGDFKNISFDALDTNAPFTLTSTVSGAPVGTGGVPGGIYGDRIAYINPQSKAFVDMLNQQYRVLSTFTPRPEIQKWAATTVEELAGATDSSYVPPTKTEAPVEPTPNVPQEAVVTKNEISFGRFHVDRTTYAIRDSQTSRVLSPPALERLRNSLKGNDLEQLNLAIDVSYNTEESDNGPAN